MGKSTFKKIDYWGEDEGRAKTNSYLNSTFIETPKKNKKKKKNPHPKYRHQHFYEIVLVKQDCGTFVYYCLYGKCIICNKFSFLTTVKLNTKIRNGDFNNYNILSEKEVLEKYKDLRYFDGTKRNEEDWIEIPRGNIIF